MDDGGTNRAPRESKASAEKLRGGLEIGEDAEALSLSQVSCRTVLGKAVLQQGPVGDVFQQSKELQSGVGPG